ncbi:MAG TPA: GspMb/PilO family protein [Burkholderiales bacterium]|nr:GspMb/PilO family protein [Burkholderiales bacterium]
MRTQISAHLYRSFWKIRDELGITGLAALLLFAGAGAFFALVLQPMKDKGAALQSRALSVQEASPRHGNAADKVGAVYEYLKKPETTTDWLAKLYAIGSATGVELQSASYKTQTTPGTKLERYEIVVPLTGSYTQMRDFLKRSLAEIPVLSLDQISLKRESRREGTVQAELHLTLHMVRS